MKAREAAKKHALMKEAVQKSDMQLEKLIKMRSLMQGRLKDIYTRNQKKASQVNREPPRKESPFSFDSNAQFDRKASRSPTDLFSNMRISNDRPSSSRESVSSFFNNPDRNIKGGSIESGSSLFPSISIDHRRVDKRSQLSRNPYFAD